MAGVAKLEEAAGQKQRELMESMRGSFQPGGDRDAMRDVFEKMQAEREKIGKQTETEVMAMMSDDQKTKLEELKGKPFDLDMRQLMMGRGGFGGGPPGGGAAGGGRGGRNRPPGENEAI